MRTFIKVLAITLLILAGVSFIFSLNATITGIELYENITNGKYDDFLTEGAYFEYIYTGDQYGKGDWEDYHWWFRETGRLEITKVENDIIEGQLVYERVEEDNEGLYNEYTCYVNFTYNITSYWYTEHVKVVSGDKTEYYTNNYIEPWFYHKENDLPIILNESFLITKKEITIYEIPVRSLFAHREENIIYVEDNISFYGQIIEDYYFDEQSGVLLKYTVSYPSMWDLSNSVGWSYYDEYVITRTNVKLAINIDETQAQVYPWIIVLKTQIWALLFILIGAITTISDPFITNRTFSKAVKNIKNFSSPQPVTRLSPVYFDVYANGWLSDGFVVFKRGSESHVLADLRKEEQHALDTTELFALEKLLAFDELNESDVNVLNAINSKCNCVELRGMPRSDPILVDKLKEISKRYIDNVLKAIKSPEAYELLEFAFEIMGYRKVLAEMFGQAYALPPYNLFRAWKIYERVGIGRVLLIGDDDFLSILLAKLGVSVSVIDVDPYVLRVIRYLSQRYGLEGRIELFYHDIREPFTIDTRFSAVHMDPGYSLDGLLLFLSRGLACLRLGGTLFVSWNSKGANKDLLEKALVAHNINILERAKIKLRYLVPVAGYYSHIRTKYGGHTIFIPPTIRVGAWKAIFYIGTLQRSPNFVVKPDFAYTGVLY